MKLVKTTITNEGFTTKRYFDLGSCKKDVYGPDTRKVLIETELSNGQGQRERFYGCIKTDANGAVTIETIMNPYKTQLKGCDY